MLRLVGAVLVEINEEWLAGNFIDKKTLQGVLRREEHVVVSDDIRTKAFILIRTAIETAGRAA